MILKLIRKYAKKLLIIIAAFIIPAFVLWGAGGAIRGGRSGQHAGRIFGKRISLEEFTNSWYAVKNQALMLYGDNLEHILPLLDLERQAWERLILLEEARRSGIQVTEREIVDVIKNMPFFQREGKFDKETYQIVLRYVFRTSDKNFENQIKNSLIIEKLISNVLDEVEVSQEELKKAYKIENEMVNSSYVLFIPENYALQVEINKENLKEYFNINKPKFRQPPKIKISHLEIPNQYFKDDITITDEEIKNYFIQNKENFINAQENNHKELSEETEDINLTDKIKYRIKNILIEEKNKEKTIQLVEKISNFLIQTPDLEKASKEFSLNLKTTDYFSANEPIPNIGWSHAINQKAFSMKKGDISDYIEVPAKGFYFVKLIDRKDSYMPEIQEVEEQVKKEYIKYQSKIIAEQKTKENLDKLKNLIEEKDISWEEATEKLNLEAKTTGFFKRESYIRNIGLSEKFSEASFNTPVNQIYNSPVKTNKGFCIIKPIDKKSIDITTFEKEKEDFLEKYLTQKKQNHYREWFDNLIRKSNLECNLDNLRRQAEQQQQEIED